MPATISIKLLKDSSDVYAIDLYPTVLRVSPVDKEKDVILTFELGFTPSRTPNLAQAIISFRRTPFDEEPRTVHRINVGSITIPNLLRENAVGLGEQDVALYKYTITVITPEGEELPRARAAIKR